MDARTGNPEDRIYWIGREKTRIVGFVEVVLGRRDASNHELSTLPEKMEGALRLLFVPFHSEAASATLINQLP